MILLGEFVCCGSLFGSISRYLFTCSQRSAEFEAALCLM